VRGTLEPIQVVAARPADLERYIDFLERVADWLTERGIRQWTPGDFRLSAAFYAASIDRGEVYLACSGETLAGTLRLLLREPIVWPDIVDDDGVYVYNLAVGRDWAGQGLGRELLEWVVAQAASLGRRCVRLDCFTDNAFLRRYYIASGFEDRGDIEAQFPAPVGTLLLRRYERPVRRAGQADRR
jgi:ribosomal protein S18 acetylase RimI-like enzyme